jgi:multimeric flavodoxin WrbA/putative sterol carrier protein
MKLLVFQGSPRPKGYTQMVLEKFLQGAASKGASSEVIFLAGKKVKPCIGCYSCWYKTPGVCIHKGDDVPEILEKMKCGDMEVYATPLYHYGMTAFMKLFMERTLPLMLPYLVENQDGGTTHPERYPGTRARGMVLISVCGFPEVDHFKALVAQFRLLARSSQKKLAGVLLRPGSESMLFMERLGKKGKDVLEGFFRAGQEIATRGEVSPETEEIVSRDWTQNLRAFREQANAFWDVRMDHAKKVKGGSEDRTFEEAVKEDIRIVLRGMAASFRGHAAEGLRTTIQFDISGSQPGQWYYEIQDGYCSFKKGNAEKPNLIIHTPAEVWLAISKGEADGGKAFLEKKYTVEGDLNLLMRFKALFGDP